MKYKAKFTREYEVELEAPSMQRAVLDIIYHGDTLNPRGSRVFTAKSHIISISEVEDGK